MSKIEQEIKHIYINADDMAQLSDAEERAYVKCLCDKVLRANAEIRAEKMPKEKVFGDLSFVAGAYL